MTNRLRRNSCGCVQRRIRADVALASQPVLPQPKPIRQGSGHSLAEMIPLRVVKSNLERVTVQ